MGETVAESIARDQQDQRDFDASAWQSHGLGWLIVGIFVGLILAEAIKKGRHP